MIRLLLLAGFLIDETAPYRHSVHAPLKLKCTGCHVNAEKEDSATFPEVATCRTCHTGMAERTIPSKRLFRIPDFVFFGHGSHAAAKVECAACHGDVWSAAGPREAKPMKMAECVDCHRERKAVLACNACHELGQD